MMHKDIHIHLHLSDGADESVNTRLTAIESTLQDIYTQGEEIMGNITLAREALNTLNENTNQLAAVVESVVVSDQAEDDAFRAEIQALKDQIAAGEVVTAADLDELTQGIGGSTETLKAVKTALEAMGKRPEDPLPPIEVDPIVVDPVVIDPVVVDPIRPPGGGGR